MIILEAVNTQVSRPKNKLKNVVSSPSLAALFKLSYVMPTKSSSRNVVPEPK